MFWVMFNSWVVLHWYESGFHSMNHETHLMHGKIFRLIFKPELNVVEIQPFSRDYKLSAKIGRFYYTLED